MRGVVSDAVPCLFNGVICDLPFNVVGLPKKMGSMYDSTSPDDLSIPHRLLGHKAENGLAQSAVAHCKECGGGEILHIMQRAGKVNRQEP